MLRFRFFLASLVCLMAGADGFTQNAPANTSNFAYSSPSGNYLVLNVDGKTVSVVNPKGFYAERSTKGDNKFTKLGDFAPVQSYEAFQQLAGAPMANDFKLFIKAKTDADVVRFFNTTHASKDYGFFIFDINFLRAMGLVYLDPMSADKTAGYEYRLKNAAGTVLRQQTPVAFNQGSLPRGLVKKIFSTDSLISIRWDFPAYQSSLPVFARVYKQEGGSGKFLPMPVKTTLNATDKNAYAVYEQRTTPEQLISYYVVPVDIIGNEGFPSDTATAISIDYKKIPGLRDITVTDSLGGLLCEWKPLPRKPWYTGIQILRSRDARKDFIVLDSVAVTASTYLDKQVLPNVTYFYKFRVIVYKLSGYDEITATTVHGTKSSATNPPLAPKNLQAFKDGRNIKVTWSPNTELDLFAYYVLRGTSDRNMEIVSPAIMDTSWIDSSATLSGRTNYVYSVLGMNNNQLKSAPALAAGVAPARAGFIETPAGITIRPAGAKLLLTWTDTRKTDVAVAGYILYKRKAGEQRFTPVSDALITRAYYEDAAITANTGYVYAVSAVDRFGYEGSRSPDAPFLLRVNVQPPAQVFVRKLSGGVEVSWPRNAATDITTYNIYRKTTKSAYVKLGTVRPGELFFSDKKFVTNELNIYAVSITTNNGESEKSVEKALFVNK